jgi:hypothetical protein
MPAMKIVFCLISAIALLHGALFHAGAEEPAGKWQAPPADGRMWKHAGTGLRFPQFIGKYRLMAEFSYDSGGVFIRYENLEQRARGDIFFFRATGPTAQLEDRHRLILKEMDTVIADLRGMANQGRYKNIQIGDVESGQIPLWQQDPLPIATRLVTCTRIANSKEGVQEAVIKQWTGISVVNGHLFTIRHMRPADTGEPGEQDMKAFVGTVFQAIKDPPLRAEVKKMIEAYLLKPLSTESDQAAGAVLAYLNQTPFFPIQIPEYPISLWLEHCKALAPGTEDHLLRAFMLGSAKAAFDDSDANACLEAGSRQFARIYRQLVQQHPKIALPQMDQFVAAAEKDQGAAWLKANSKG